MPVTAKLSRKFYEKFGDDITNELVDWFNKVDATYRTELRELNELNFGRFDAKLEQRTGGLDANWDRRFTRLEAKLDTLKADLMADIAGAEARIIRWTFLFFAASLGTLIALVRL
jgi:hypothetical protein